MTIKYILHKQTTANFESVSPLHGVLVCSCLANGRCKVPSNPSPPSRPPISTALRPPIPPALRPSPIPPALRPHTPPVLLRRDGAAGGGSRPPEEGVAVAEEAVTRARHLRLILMYYAWLRWRRDGARCGGCCSSTHRRTNVQFFSSVALILFRWLLQKGAKKLNKLQTIGFESWEFSCNCIQYKCDYACL